MTGVVYVIFGLLSGHFRKSLLPDPTDRSWTAFTSGLADHVRFTRRVDGDAWSYNLLQRLVYLIVIFVLFPLAIWTGLAMSPAFVSAIPAAVAVFGRQSARTLHFVLSVSLVLFLLVHVGTVWRSGFRNRVKAMMTARAPGRQETV